MMLLRDGFPILVIFLTFIPEIQTSLFEGKLISAHLLCRHGSRGPYSYFSNVTQIKWNDHKQQLSVFGIRQSYDQGKYFRERYNNFTAIPLESIHIKSSIKDRVFQSTEAFAAGLYTPKQEERFKKDLPWIPQQIDVISVKHDYYIHGVSSKLCPTIYNRVTDVLNSKQFHLILNDYKEAANKYCRLAGFPLDSSINSILKCVYGMVDLIYASKAEGIALKEWATNDVQNEMIDFRRKLNNLFFTNKGISFICKGGGPLLGLILNEMSNTLATAPEHPLIYVYGMHGSTMSGFYGSLGIAVKRPPFAECTALEVRNINGTNYVEMLSKFYNSKSIKRMRIPQCGKTCKYDEFKRNLRPMVNAAPSKYCSEALKVSNEDETVRLLLTLTGLSEDEEKDYNLY